MFLRKLGVLAAEATRGQRLRGYVSQLERATGQALALLHIIKRKGIQAIL